MKTFSEFGLAIPHILLPAKADISTWSVIACDQYTQDRSYWERVSATVGMNPSTLNLILPEVYLEADDKTERISAIKRTMKGYLSGNVFADEVQECLYVERRTAYGRVRHGLVCAIDLDSYEWKPFSHALIRATEATILDRIPPRKEIRQGAPLESPHIMLLVNDPDHLFVESVGTMVKKNTPVYDGELMLGSGHVTGWAIQDDAALSAMYNALSVLKAANTDEMGAPFLFAVGDGNHSLATAKAVWNEYREQELANGKSENVLSRSPARYALVEVVNLYDSGLTFEPIHRVLFCANPSALIGFVQQRLGGTVTAFETSSALAAAVEKSKSSFGFVFKEPNGSMRYDCLESAVQDLAVSRLQPELDSFLDLNAGSSIDYIHGSDEVFRLGAMDNTVAILLPPVSKDSFFAAISTLGPLPRKSFSMGEASEKRFYLECRRLFS